VTLEEKDVGFENKSTVKSDWFHLPKSLPRSGVISGIDADGIMDDRASWPSSGPQLFCNNQCLLLEALAIADRSAWPHLWVAGLFRSCMVISDMPPAGQEAQYFVVIDASTYMLRLWKLQRDGSGYFTFCFEATSLVTTVVASLTTYSCHDFSLLFRVVGEQPQVLIDVENVQSLPDYLVDNHLPLLPSSLLHRICGLENVRCPKNPRVLDALGLLLDHWGVSEERCGAYLFDCIASASRA
jgi:hypothetical protein